MAPHEKGEDLDPEVAARLARIRGRDIEQMQKDYMDRCLHIKWKLGFVSIYLNPFTTIVSAAIIWAFVIYCVVEKEEANEELKKLRVWITEKWTWLYVGTQDVWAIFIFWLYFSKYGNIKLGRDDEPEEYSDGTYFTMLFSAGVGIGLFFFGVAEPILHYAADKGYKTNRYYQRYNDNVQAQDAMNITFFHWGIHGWIVYVVIALLLGLLCYRRGLPMTMRTCFYPILGDKIFGIMGDIIDIFCIICTMFGVCTSLGLGVIQLNSGLHRLNTDISENSDVQTVIIWCITAVATVSVISGIKVGIRRLSEICFGIGCVLLFIVLFADDSWFLANLYVQSLGYYCQWIIQLGFHTDAFAQLDMAPDGKEAPEWMEEWTIFYWGWWISWSPFVGMFVAKVSRGRSIKDFILYTLTLPCLYSFLWLTVFGGAAIRYENMARNAGLNKAMYDKKNYNLSLVLSQEDLDKVKDLDSQEDKLHKLYNITLLSGLSNTQMWFALMETYGDLGTFLTVISVIAIILYFVTSSDSGSLVIDCLSANGNPEPPIIQRVFWALTEGATATALLVAGGRDALVALQTVSVACGLPITFLLNWTCVAIYRALREESGEIEISDERWEYSMWDLNSMRRFKKAAISLFAPWYYLAKIRMMLDDKTSVVYQVVYSLWFGLPFYLWIILMICEVKVEAISYVGWAILLFFFAIGAGARGDIRRRYMLDGDMVEDFFALMLVYPLAIQAMHEQLVYGELPVEGGKQGNVAMIEMGNGSKEKPPNDKNGVHMVSHNKHAV